MPFSQWNTLEVPLQNGWQCTLVPAGQYRHAVWAARGSMSDCYPLRRPRWGWPDDRDRPWGHAAGRTREAWRDDHERQRWERDERERQRDEDRCDFYRYFRPDDDLRTITGRRDLETVREFLTDIMVFAHWDEPETNEDIRRVLCGLVSDRQLVPNMKREWRQLPRVFRPNPAAERWPVNSNGFSPTSGIISYADFVALQRANGELGKVPSSAMAVGRAAMLDPLSDTGAAAGAGEASRFSDGALGDTTPRVDAAPFEYVPDVVSKDVEQLAASTNNPKFAARMLGYDQRSFGDVLHRFKPDNGLGPADNVIWHDNGDVYFNGKFIANFHDWAN